MGYLLKTLRAYSDASPASFGAADLEISSSNISFQISLIDIDSLKPHEEVIDALVDSLADAVKLQGNVRDPIIVDQEELVILDGMHRHDSLKRLNCRFAPCCLVNYDNPLIKVGSWFRLFNVREAESTAEKLLKDRGLQYERKPFDRENPTQEPLTIILTGNGNRYSLISSLDLTEFSKTAVILEKALVKQGHHADYLSDSLALQALRVGHANLVISLPVFSKNQIREYGMRGPLLPHKVTRHVMPSRPLRINTPLSILTDPSSSQAEANRKLGETLTTRHVDRKPPGLVVDGRRYEEELLVFTS